MPGTRTLWTNWNWAVTSAGRSTRGTEVPSTVHERGSFRFAFGFSARLSFFPPTSSPYATFFDGSLVAVITPLLTVS